MTPDDKVNREFTATAPKTSSGCRTSLTTGFVPDALNQAVCQQCPAEGSGLIHHRDRDGQYLSIRYTERLAEAGIDT